MMYNLKQELGIKENILNLVTYVTNNKTSNRMIINARKILNIALHCSLSIECSLRK